MKIWLLLVLAMLLPWGLSGAQQIWAVRIILYVLVAFALLGGVFSVRVAWLRKRLG